MSWEFPKFKISQKSESHQIPSQSNGKQDPHVIDYKLASHNFKLHPISFVSQFPVSSSDSVTSSPKTCTSRPFTTSTPARLPTSLPPKRLAKTVTLSTKRRDKKTLMVVVKVEQIATTYSGFDKQLGFFERSGCGGEVKDCQQPLKFTFTNPGECWQPFCPSAFSGRCSSSSIEGRDYWSQFDCPTVVLHLTTQKNAFLKHQLSNGTWQFQVGANFPTGTPWCWLLVMMGATNNKLGDLFVKQSPPPCPANCWPVLLAFRLFWPALAGFCWDIFTPHCWHSWASFQQDHALRGSLAHKLRDKSPLVRWSWDGWVAKNG